METLLIELAKQVPALVVFVVLVRIGMGAVEKRDKAFLSALDRNTRAILKISRSVSRTKKRPGGK